MTQRTMINEQTSLQQFKRIREEGYTGDDMRHFLFDLKDKSWIKVFQWQKQKIEPIDFLLFRLRHTSKSDSICDD